MGFMFNKKLYEEFRKALLSQLEEVERQKANKLQLSKETQELKNRKEQAELERRKEEIFKGKEPLGPLVYEELPENSRIKHEIDRYRKQKEQEEKQEEDDLEV